MKAELEQSLLDRFGKFLHLDNSGFRCKDGWYVIIFLFLQKLEAMGHEVRFSTVKEKYGWLRTYPDFEYCAGHRFGKTDMLHPKVLAAIHELEWKSYETCEFCGHPGVIRWDYEHIRTLCDGCVASYDSPKRIWSEDVQSIIKPGGELNRLAGYNRT